MNTSVVDIASAQEKIRNIPISLEVVEVIEVISRSQDEGVALVM